eukprot:gene6359-6592_t
MAPALVIPLGDPLMTLTDTIFIGQCAGTRELAALGPANIIFGFSQYVFQALQIAAISLISDDLRKGLLDRAEHTLRIALTLAVLAGFAVMLFMEVAAEQLILMTGADAALVPLSVSYMRIRALAQPAVLTIMVCQAGLLAQQDSRTPALAVVLAVLVNIVSNFVAVTWLGLGLQGAAATTVATQVVGASALLAVASRGSALRPALTSLGMSDLRLFAQTMGPLSVTYVCKNLCYILLQTAAASLNWVQLAAHQAVFSVWNLLAFTTAPLEQAALAYIPSASTRLQQQSTVQVLLMFACCIGIGCGLLAAGVPLLAPQLLTKDPAVWVHMSRVAPMALLAMVLTAADVGATGILLARRDLSYVARAYLVTLSALVVYVVVAPIVLRNPEFEFGSVPAPGGPITGFTASDWYDNSAWQYPEPVVDYSFDEGGLNDSRSQCIDLATSSLGSFVQFGQDLVVPANGQYAMSLWLRLNGNSLSDPVAVAWGLRQKGTNYQYYGRYSGYITRSNGWIKLDVPGAVVPTEAGTGTNGAVDVMALLQVYSSPASVCIDGANLTPVSNELNG